MARKLLGVLVIAIPLVLAVGSAPAAADLDGPCTAQGTFRPPGVTEGEGISIDPASTARAEIPRESTVGWTGSVNQPNVPRSYNGAVFIDTSVSGFVEFFAGSSFDEFEDWEGDDETGTTKSGIENYNVTDWIPSGAEVDVAGFHADAGLLCTGSVTLVLAGSPWDSPTTLIAVLGIPIFLLALFFALRGGGPARPLGLFSTLLFGIILGLLLGGLVFDSGAGLAIVVLLGGLGLLAAILTRRSNMAKVRGHPNVGWVGGLLGGLLIAVLGWALGVYPLGSPLFVLIPIFLMLIGFGAGLWGPLGRAAVPAVDVEPA